MCVSSKKGTEVRNQEWEGVLEPGEGVGVGDGACVINGGQIEGPCVPPLSSPGEKSASGQCEPGTVPGRREN